MVGRMIGMILSMVDLSFIVGVQYDLDFTPFTTEEDYDVVSVYDSATVNARLLGRDSLTILPSVLQSGVNVMLIRFVSGGSISNLD